MTAPRYGAGVETIDLLTDLVLKLRPDWERYLVRQVIGDLAPRISLEDLIVGCTRAAADVNFRLPKSMAWSGRAWEGLATKPPDSKAFDRCGVCGRLEPDCAAVRPGGDDHLFEPVTDARLLRR